MNFSNIYTIFDFSFVTYGPCPTRWRIKTYHRPGHVTLDRYRGVEVWGSRPYTSGLGVGGRMVNRRRGWTIGATWRRVAPSPSWSRLVWGPFEQTSVTTLTHKTQKRSIDLTYEDSRSRSNIWNEYRRSVISQYVGCRGMWCVSLVGDSSSLPRLLVSRAIPATVGRPRRRPPVSNSSSLILVLSLCIQ